MRSTLLDHSLADAHVVCPEIREQDRAVGDDVALRTRRDAADGQHDEFAGLRFPGHDRL